MSSPGGGKNKLNTQTFKDLQTTPKILFIVALTISILGLIGAIVGATSIKSGGGKAAAGLIGGGVCAGTGYWAYSIFTDKKNLKTCNVSLWTKDSTYTYAVPSGDPNVKNISVCDAQKMAEYDNGETKWFLTRPNVDVSSNVDVWFYTDKTVKVNCPGPCTLYTCTSTTTSRKVDTPTRTGCSPTGGGSGGNRSPGSGSSGGGGGGGGGPGGCALGDFTKGTGSGCDATAPNCHNGIKGSCCTDTQNGCANLGGTQLTCNSKTNLLTGESISKCCLPGTIWSETVGDCVTPANGSACGDDSDCIVTGNTAVKCVKSQGATTGKCCLPNNVLNPSGNCSAGTNGDACTTAANCTGGRLCSFGHCCLPGYEWDNPSNSCQQIGNRQVNAQCSAIQTCAAGLVCSSQTNKCELECPGQFFAPSCSTAACQSGNDGSCCEGNADCAGGRDCSKADNTGAATGICCPSTHEKFGNTCIPKTGIPNGSACRVPTNCASGNCYNGTCRPGGYCEANEDCGGTWFDSTPACENNRCYQECRPSQHQSGWFSDGNRDCSGYECDYNGGGICQEE